MRKMMALAGYAVAETLYVPIRPLSKQRVPRKTSVYDYDRETFSEKFRFRSPEDLERLILALKIPNKVSVHGYTFTSHEVVMISLLRLAYPLRWSDVQAYVPGRKHWQLRRAFYWFIDFMIVNWGYLITNNREYWLEELPKSAESIRVKLSTLSNKGYRQHYPPLGEHNGFPVFGFIDNTLFAMSRPGGGPIGEGEQAPRFPKELQRAWWTGWKKLHGLKWQTVVMANGMDFEVWGPVSVRHPDGFTLRRSRIEEKLEELQAGVDVKCVMHGDSAYFDDEYLRTGGGKGMSSCRETIEWSYKDLKNYWKCCNLKICMKLRKQPIAKIIFVCMILRNLHVTMYANQTAGYFLRMPPDLEHYLGQGPAARPIPDDIIFSDNFVPEEVSDSSDDEEEEDAEHDD